MHHWELLGHVALAIGYIALVIAHVTGPLSPSSPLSPGFEPQNAAQAPISTRRLSIALLRR
jgi:hypothetical protein